MKKLIYSAILIVIATPVFAGACPPGTPAHECMTVEGPKETEPGSGMGGIIIDGIIANPSGLSSGGKPVTADFVSTRGEKQAKDAKNKKEKEGKKDETSWYDALLALFNPKVAASKLAIQQLKDIFAFHSDNTEKKKIIKRDPASGAVIEEHTIESCKSTTLGTSTKPSCTELKMTPFTDPSDGLEKVLFTISEVESMKNPRHGPFQKPYIFKYISSFQFVAASEQDIEDFFHRVHGF